MSVRIVIPETQNPFVHLALYFLCGVMSVRIVVTETQNPLIRRALYFNGLYRVILWWS